MVAEEFSRLESEINNADHSIAAYIEKDDTIYINSKHAYVWEDVQDYIK